MSGGTTFATLDNRQHKRGATQLVLVTIAVAILATRIAEVPDHPFALIRIVLSVLAIAFVFFGRVATIGRRAIAIIAIDAVVGFATFALVDVPFIVDHQRQIGQLVVSVAGKLENAGDPGVRAIR